MSAMQLSAVGSLLTVATGINLTNTQVDYDQCVFTFDSAWAGYAKTAVFYADVTNVVDVVLVNGACFIPWDSFSANKRYLYVGVYGTLGASILPTNFVEVQVKLGANVQETAFRSPTPSVYAQLLAAYNAANDNINDMSDDIAGNTSAIAGNTSAIAGNTSAIAGNTSAIAALATGSPAGVYADLAALNAADPDHSKIYVTVDDGKWCYYDTGTSLFVSGEVYQVNLLKDDVDEATYYPNLKRIWHEVVMISSSTGNWVLWSDFKSSLLEIHSNESYILKNHSIAYRSSFAFLKTTEHVVGEVPNYATGYTGPSPMVPDSFVIVKAPSDAKYLWISTAGDPGVSNYVHIEPYSGNDVNLTYNSRFIGLAGFSDDVSRSGWVFPVLSNKKYKIVSENGNDIVYALLSSVPLITDETPPFSYDGRRIYSGLSQLSIITPQSAAAQYVWVAGTFDNIDYEIKVYDMGGSDTITVASSDSGGYKEDADFVCDGVNDEIELQAATDSLTNGGTISLSPGNFYIDSFDSFAVNGIAVLAGYNNGNARTINYNGTIQNKSYNTRFGTTIHVTSTAVSSRNVATTNIVFIGTSQKPTVGEGDAQFDYTYVNNVNFNNFYLYTDSAFEGFVGIDCSQYGCSQIEQVCVATEDFYYNRFHHIKQTTPGENSIGISSNNSSNDEMALCSYENLDVGGMYIAYQFNGVDHLVMRNCFAARNVYGYYFKTNYKTQTMINCADEGNYHAPYFMGTGHITIIDFCIELSDFFPDDVNASVQMRATEETAGGWGGSVTYTGQGYKPFWAVGSGINIETKCLENPIVGVTAVPEYLQRYFDTVNNVWLTWNGSAWV